MPLKEDRKEKIKIEGERKEGRVEENKRRKTVTSITTHL